MGESEVGARRPGFPCHSQGMHAGHPPAIFTPIVIWHGLLLSNLATQNSPIEKSAHVPYLPGACLGLHGRLLAVPRWVPIARRRPRTELSAKSADMLS
jgi:hypothetical protein